MAELEPISLLYRLLALLENSIRAYVRAYGNYWNFINFSFSPIFLWFFPAGVCVLICIKPPSHLAYAPGLITTFIIRYCNLFNLNIFLSRFKIYWFKYFYLFQEHGSNMLFSIPLRYLVWKWEVHVWLLDLSTVTANLNNIVVSWDNNECDWE